MRDNSLLEELHAIRAAISKECHDDLGEIVAHLQKRSRDAGRVLVDLRPKPAPKRVPKPTAPTRTRRRTA